MLGLRAHHLHVRDRRAAVLGGDVAAAEIVHEAAEGLEQRLAIERSGRQHDHRLAAPVLQARERRLGRHRARETQRVDERGLFARVAHETSAAERGPEARVVNRNNRVELAAYI